MFVKAAEGIKTFHKDHARVPCEADHAIPLWYNWNSLFLFLLVDSWRAEHFGVLFSFLDRTP